MSKKPSFFEKLTGASWSDADTEEALGEEPTISVTKSKRAKKATREPVSKIKIPKIKPAPAKKIKNIATEETESTSFFQKRGKKEPDKKENEEWLTESEGQLTIDVYQTPNEIVIKSTIAGVRPEDIDITMANDMITIKGTREKDEDVSEEDYYYQECYWGPFSRSIILPIDVEVDQSEALMKNGILTIRLPKAEKVKTKKIAIRAE